MEHSFPNFFIPIYCECWRYNECWGPSFKWDFSSYCPGAGRSSIFLSASFFQIVNPCDSWERFRSHWIKANRRFAYANGKMQIVDLLFSSASWIFLQEAINKKRTKLEEDLSKIDGENKEGKRHHGWFAYIAIIHNIFFFNKILRFLIWF